MRPQCSRLVMNFELWSQHDLSHPPPQALIFRLYRCKQVSPRPELAGCRLLTATKRMGAGSHCGTGLAATAGARTGTRRTDSGGTTLAPTRSVVRAGRYSAYAAWFSEHPARHTFEVLSDIGRHRQTVDPGSSPGMTKFLSTDRISGITCS